MTKQDFLNGTEFKIKGINGQFKLSNNGGCIVEVYRNKEGKYVTESYVMNTEGIGTKRVQLYTFILGDKIKKTLYYSDMVEYVSSDNE